ISRELIDLLVRYNISFITAHHLYGLWQKAKRGEIDIFEFFQKIYSQGGKSMPEKESKPLFPLSLNFPSSKSKSRNLS
ncbi:MAG: hypothetical protein Q8N70_04010, partial [Deltaproteobacteria bacterium]|nr:hypothetical protein [Deltaproteobacteria bacterium]